MIQSSLPGIYQIEKTIDLLSEAGVEERGAVFTRPDVVNFILDLVGYTSDFSLHRKSFLEPSFGKGDFLLPAVDRLLKSYSNRHKYNGNVVRDLKNSVRAVELHRDSFEITRSALHKKLTAVGISSSKASELLGGWLINGDFLLTRFPFQFTYVVGNPPYVRQELIPDILLMEYRKYFQTIFDRSDLYVPFFEKSLGLLDKSGVLGFICADRWMKNRYGGPLRRLIANQFRLKYYVDMTGFQAFYSDVSAYPAITVITNEPPGPTRVARPATNEDSLSIFSKALLGDSGGFGDYIKEVMDIAADDQPWLLDTSDRVGLVRKLESTFPTLEEAGCKVGIGVATGADKVFVGPYDELDVEPGRKLPLVMTRDIPNGTIVWRGNGLINPFKEDGSLVNLRDYPKLAAYLDRNKEKIINRFVAKQKPEEWYKTIDRICPDLLKKPKLLIPDIKEGAHVVYDEGHFYPHHNLYYIVSDSWDLQALQAVLLSGVARLFVSTYTTKMRGNYLRFQAQYLRRIRIPRWENVPRRLKNLLINSVGKNDSANVHSIVYDIYGLSKKERKIIGKDIN